MVHGSLSLDMKLFPGQAIGLLGPNGVGKSSLMQYFKLQQKKLFPHLLVGFLDQSPLLPLGPLTGRDLFDMLKEEFSERCLYPSLQQFSLIREFSWDRKLDLPIRSLSGGENQVLKILALFFLKSQVYLLDEPATHLDLLKRKILVRYLQNILKENSSPQYMVIIEHHKEFLWEICAGFVPILKMKVGQYMANHFTKKEEVSEELWEFWTQGSEEETS